MVRFVSFVTRFIAAIIKIIKCEAERLSFYLSNVCRKLFATDDANSFLLVPGHFINWPFYHLS
jgi:hypothetical protein